MKRKEVSFKLPPGASLDKAAADMTRTSTFGDLDGDWAGRDQESGGLGHTSTATMDDTSLGRNSTASLEMGDAQLSRNNTKSAIMGNTSRAAAEAAEAAGGSYLSPEEVAQLRQDKEQVRASRADTGRARGQESSAAERAGR